jgi:MFS family permease
VFKYDKTVDMRTSIFTRRNATILAGIFTLAVLSRFDSIISPSLAAIQTSFPEENPSTVESLATIGATAAIVSALLFGKLMEWLSFKVTGAISCLCISFGGLMPLFFHSSLSQLLIFAVITGFGAGILTTVLPSLSAHFFSGSQLSGLMGKVLAMQDGSSMVVLALGGMLATGGWIRNYWLYGLGLLGLVFVLLFVPGVKAADTDNHEVEDTQSDNEHQSITGEVQTVKEGSARESKIDIAFCIFIGFLSIFLVAVLYNKLAVYISQYHLGGTDAAGFALMFNTGSSVVIGFSINRLRSWLKDYTLSFAFVLMVFGAVIFLTTRSFPLVCLGAFLVGSGSAIIMATCPFLLSNLASIKHYPLVMGIFSAMTSLGFTISTWVFKFLADVFKMDPVLISFWGMGLIAVLAAVTIAACRFQSRIEAHYLAN